MPCTMAGMSKTISHALVVFATTALTSYASADDVTPPAPPAPTEAPAPPAAPAEDTTVAQATPVPASAPVATVDTAPAITAEEKPDEQATTPPNVELNGSFDAYSAVNFTRPDSNVNKLRAFDGQDGGLALNYAELVLARNKGPLGFRLDAGFGAASDALFAVDNASASMDESVVDRAKALSHIQQAYVTGHVGKLTLDLGKFVTQHGYEVIETKDNWNYSRSILFTWAIPFLHTGLRATYPVNDQLTVMGCWVNGWNTNIADGNTMTSGGVQAIYKPTAPLSLVLNYMGGRERGVGVEDLTIRHLVDASATYTINEAVTVAVNGDYGHDAANGGVSWAGIAGYGRYQILPYVATSARVEYFTDPDGFMTTIQQKLIEGTATAEVSGKIGPTAVIGRLEYRHDHSNAAFFDASMPTMKKNQDTVLVGAVAAF